MNRPLLKQFTELAAADFEAFPVWVAVHVADYDEPWSHDTDEETFRPYTGTLPADPTELVLVAATATLDDGTVFPAFLTPSELAGDLARLQPHVFVGGESYGFWGGAFGIPEARRREFLARAGRHERDVFPIRFTADPTLSNGVTETAVPGWL